MRAKIAKKLARNPAAAKGAERALRQIRWLVPGMVAATTLLVFLPALQNEFLAWDDEDLLLKNSRYRGLGEAELRWMFTTFHFGHYQPLTWMTFGLDYLLWGMDPFGYHLTNLLLHSANAVLFYFLALRLLALALSPSAAPQEALALRLGAGVAALLFSIHPLRAESVAWVTERRDVLSAFFFLGALCSYLQVAASSQSPQRKLAWLGGTLLVYSFSLLSKGAGMTLPVVLVVLDVYPLRRLGGGPGKWFGPEARKVWWEKAPFLVLGLAAAVVAALAQYESGAMLSMERHGLIPRLAQAVFGLAFYLWKTVIPLGLSPLYEIPQHVQLWDWPILLSGVIVLTVSAGLVMMRRLWPAGLATWICYAAILAPTLGAAQSGPQFVADRYSYLSCMGWAILAGAGLYRGWRASRMRPRGRLVFPAVAGVVAIGLAGLAVLTWRQAQVWRNTETLWRYAVSATPESSGAHYNLALLVEARGKSDEAEQHYRQALEINPAYMRAHNNLGVMLAKQNRLAEAIEHYNKVVKIDPSSAEAHNNLGNALFRRGELDEAVRHYREAVRSDPEYVKAYNGLGIALTNKGNLEEAIASFRMAFDIDPNYASAYLNLGNVLAGRGELEAAMSYYRRALQIEPKLAAAHQALGRILALQGRRGEAIQHMEEALRIMRATPGQP